MRYIPVILALLFFAALGCLGSTYRETAASELLLNPESFEGKKICITGVLENNTISGVRIGENQVIARDEKNGTLAEVCGIYRARQIEVYSINPVLRIFTEKDTYHSNETLKVGIFFNSPKDGRGQVRASGIKNAFGRASLNQTKEENIKKGANRFEFELRTPSCEECTAVSPGVHVLNATVYMNGKTFETYKKITLEREGNVSDAHNPRTNITQAAGAQAASDAQNKRVTVEYFFIPGCPKCEKAAPVIENAVGSYGGRVDFSKYNANEEGRALAIEYQIPGVPSVIINRSKLIAYEDYEGDTAKLEALLKSAIESGSASSKEVPGQKQVALSVPSVLVVGFLAGFNPCLLAILAFIASVTLATTGRRRNVLLIVLMFSLGIFVTYLIVGIGILRVFEQSPELQTTTRNILVALISLLGLWHVYDAWHLRKNTESSFHTPKAFIRLTESVTKNVSLPASFFIGALFSLIKAPCVGAVYLVILDMVRSGESAGILYLAAYNLGVVLPVLLLGGAIAFGLSPEKVERFRKEKRSAMRLVTGITLLIIAVLMYRGII